MRSATSIGLADAERNARRGFHDDLPAAFVVRTGLGREALRPVRRRLGSTQPGENADELGSLRRTSSRGPCYRSTVPPWPQHRRRRFG